MGLFSNDIAMALADDAFVFDTVARQRPVPIPAYAARTVTDGKLIAFGEDARQMVGRAPANIRVIRLLVEGMPIDIQACTEIAKSGFRGVSTGKTLLNPRVVVAVRAQGTGDVPVKNLVLAAGAREVYLIEHGMACAIGMGLEVQTPKIKAVLSMSEDWFEFSVISLAGIMASATGSVGLRTLIEDARNHLRLSKAFVPEEDALRTALLSQGIHPGIPLQLPGWEAWLGRTETGRHTESDLSSDLLATGIMPSLIRMTERIKSVIEELTREQQAELARAGIHGCGIGLAAPGLPEAIAAQLGIPVTFTPGKIHPAIGGTTEVAKEMGTLARAVGKASRR